jgi:hypothetical protein
LQAGDLVGAQDQLTAINSGYTVKIGEKLRQIRGEILGQRQDIT